MLRRPVSTNFWRKFCVLGALGLSAALFLGLGGCYPGGPENLGEIGMVVTLQNPDGNFAGLRTYAMDDTVRPLVNPDDPSSEPLDPELEALILSELHSQMVARGFTLEANPENNTPDVHVLVGAVQSDAYIAYSYWPYYPGYWGPGWGYPGYGYPGVGAIVYKQGSVLWTMVDLREASEEVDPVGLWYAGLNGALTGGGTSPTVDIPNGIRQAFAQSPYIQAVTETK